ncbi:hypothetical protein Pint_20008 [Pistacia integerrima]|uniref:Uncharacterized protein n=1 Tax=Pistacia integerrima TaxID=434235 RepID=A0ACC0XC08_9ROSI|nr:hypothetical protein Pint_20008 [Pistacia integerrima]
MKIGFSWFMGRIRRESLSVVSGGGDSVSRMKVQGDSVNVKVKEKKERAKVPFHIPAIKRPQEKYNILVNNLNHPFQHVWLQRSEDNQRFLHPLASLSVLDFVHKDIGDVEPVKPTSPEETSFKLVEEVKDLKELAAKFWSVNEFAASRVLKLERNSLEYLLQRFCGVTANKEYQNADWRLRPLPDEMLRSYKRSYDICMQLYEKKLLTENSYLYIYGLVPYCLRVLTFVSRSFPEKALPPPHTGISPSVKVAEATVQALKKPTHGFGAERKFDTEKKKLCKGAVVAKVNVILYPFARDEQPKAVKEVKVEPATSSLNLQSLSSFTSGEQPKPVVEESSSGQPLDFEAARKQIRFGEALKEESVRIDGNQKNCEETDQIWRSSEGKISED